MSYPLELSFKVLGFAPQIYLRNAEGALMLYVRQKVFKFKEEIVVYGDDQKQTQLFNINADRIIDFSARYRFTLAGEATSVGSIKRHGMRSLWRSHYEIFDEETHTHTIREENPWAKVMDGFFAEIPILGMFSGYLFHPSFVITDAAGNPVMRMTKQPAFFEGKFKVDLLAESVDDLVEWRLLLSLLMMVLLEQTRG